MSEHFYVSVEEIESTGWYLIVYENKRIILKDLVFNGRNNGDGGRVCQFIPGLCDEKIRG